MVHMNTYVYTRQSHTQERGGGMFSLKCFRCENNQQSYAHEGNIRKCLVKPTSYETLLICLGQSDPCISVDLQRTSIIKAAKQGRSEDYYSWCK